MDNYLVEIVKVNGETLKYECKSISHTIDSLVVSFEKKPDIRFDSSEVDTVSRRNLTEQINS